MMSTRGRIPNDDRYLEEREKECMRAEGPQLASFRVYGVESPFSKFIPKTCLKLEPIRNGTQPSNVRLNSDKNSNLRAFYYLLLQTSFERVPEHNFGHRAKSPERPSQLLGRLKAFLLADSVSLQPYAGLYQDPNTSKILKQSKYSKRLILEVFQALASQPNEDVLTVISKYPIVDVLLTALMRAVVAQHRPEVARNDRKIDTEIIVESLRDYFGAKIEANAFQMIFQDHYVIRQDNDYTYIKRQDSSKHESTDTTKKTEQSDNNLTNSHIFDKAKLLGETINPTIPPLNLTVHQNITQSSQPPVKIASLCDIRQCSSQRNSFDEDTSRKMSAEQYDGMKPRDVISEIDESCESSSVSCVLEKIEFGRHTSRNVSSRNVSSRNVSPRNSPRKNSPSKFMKSRNVGQEVRAEPIQGDSIKQVKYQQSPVFPGKINKKTSQFSITSKGDEQEQAQIMDCLDDDVKMTLTDGMTSQAVLKLMSPSIAKVMNQKKKQSLRSALEKYNTGHASCIRTGATSIIGGIDPSFRTSCNTNPMSSKVISEFEHRVSPVPRNATTSLYNKELGSSHSPRVVFRYTNKEQSLVQLPQMHRPKEKSLSPIPRRAAVPLLTKHFYN